MILFLKDWDKPENKNCIVHTSTKNQSFIDLANIYKKMGVKNYYFHLALHDPDLEFVDPFDPNLTPHMISKIATEIAVNPWYFFRELAQAPDSNEDTRIFFRANRANISLFWCFFNHCQYFLIQPRQTGKSFSTDIIMQYLLCFRKSLKMLLYTKDSDLRTVNVIRLRALIATLPSYLNPITRKDSNNTEGITVLSNNNYYNTIIAQESEDAAYKRGRGNTVEVRQCDEVAFCKLNHITIPSMGSSMDAARQKALEQGKETCSIFTTTAGKKDTPHGRWAYEVWNESAQFDEKYFDSFDAVEFEKRVKADSNPVDPLFKAIGLFQVQGTFSHRQLGYTDEWLIENMARNKVTGEDALRDYYNVWTSGTESSPFTVEQAQMIKNSECDPVFRDIGKFGIIINWYVDNHELSTIFNNCPVIVGLDSSSAIGKDACSLTFVNALDLNIIGTASISKVNLFQYAQWLCDLIIRFPKLLLVPENRSSAQGIIDFLIETLPAYGINPFKQIFNTIVHEKDEKARTFMMMDAHPNPASVANMYRSSFGYSTSGKGRYSRDNLYGETFYRAIDVIADKVKDKKLIRELLGLVIIDGRIDHGSDKEDHDDQVISWLLACWFIFNGRNVNYYNINKGRFLSNVVTAGEEIDPVKQMQQREQEALKDKISNLYEELSNTEDHFEFAKLEKTIRLLESRLTPESRSQMAMSVSGMIDDLKETRRINALRSSPDMLNDVMDGLSHMSDVFTGNPYFGNRYGNMTNGIYQNPNDISDINYWLS